MGPIHREDAASGPRRSPRAAPIRLAMIGLGKIARDRHLPAIDACDDVTLVATASPGDRLADVPGYDDIAALLAAGHSIDAVAICTPPGVRCAIASAAVAAGCHVLLEKPPGATLGEAQALAADAHAAGRTLFASWHSREAAGVDAAREWLTGKRVWRVAVRWQEDIRVWHPGQHWILRADGFGGFDPGINALSILTAILPGRYAVAAATLDIPQNHGAPIAAMIDMRIDGQVPVSVALDFLAPGKPAWEIEVDCAEGKLRLVDGGARLLIDGAVVTTGENVEYRRLYRHFAELVRSGDSDVDLQPLALVADALMIGTRRPVAPFDF